MLKSLRYAACFLVLVSILLSGCAVVRQGGFVESQAVDEAVVAQMAEQEIVGVAIGIIRDGQVVYTKGYGFANLRSHTPVTEETVFNWASNSKPFIAVATMQLVQSGRLDLDESVGTYIPSLPDHLKPLTARQLLCHQSGIVHYSNGEVIPWGQRAGLQEELDPFNSLHRFAMSPLIFEPGSKTQYSSHAYVLLSAVVQAAGKEPIGQQLSARIIEPLGLTSFQMDVPYENQPHWTTAYKISGGAAQEVADTAHSWKHGAGGYKSSVKDFARFATALMNRELIDEETTAVMWTPQKTSDGEIQKYGLGVAVSGEGDDLKVSHNGSQDETRTRMVLYPNKRNGVVVMCNTQGADPGRISTAIYAAMDENR